MARSLWERVRGVQSSPQVVANGPSLDRRRTIYDRLSEQRLIEQERQRFIQQHSPEGNDCDQQVGIQDVWVRLPDGSLHSQVSARELRMMGWGRAHDARLMVRQAERRPLRRIETHHSRAPSVDATVRALELLDATLQDCPLLSSIAEWAETEVHVFVSSGVDASVCFERAIALWPEHQLPAWGIHLCDRSPADWLPTLLARSSAPHVLCLSIASQANVRVNGQAGASDVLGEAVALISLMRLPATDSQRPILSHPRCSEPSRHVGRLVADLGFPAAEWVRLALTTLTARSHDGPTHSPLNLAAADSTHGWVIG